MSNRDPESREGSLTELLTFFFRQAIKNIHTCIPITFQSVDNETGRAVVQPALDLLLTDGGTLTPAPIADIPIAMPSSSAGYVWLEIARGDPGLLVVSERGVGLLKQQTASGQARPDMGSLFSLQDGFALPIAFRRTMEPPEGKVVLSDADGDNYLAIRDDGIRIVSDGTIRIETGDTYVELTGTNARVNSGRIDLN